MEKNVLSPNARYHANPDFLMRKIGGDCVLVPIGQAGILDNCILTLNETSSFLWQVFQSPCTLEEAIARCREEYDAPEELLRKDVTDFILSHREVNLLLED